MSGHDDFEKGDIVRLKSGGPQMTVSKVKTTGGFGDTPEQVDKVRCHWFSGANRKNGKFQPEELEHLDEDEEDG